MKKLAIVMINLGGPSDLKAVKPFLFNLFNDPFIIPFPKWPRYMLARLISTLRFKKAQDIYKRMGGKSPLLENTESQAQELMYRLQPILKDTEIQTFVCMRYWHPMAMEVSHKIADFNPDTMILLPLYPQFSTTTTHSSFLDFEKHWKMQEASKFVTSYKRIGCYANHPLFIKAWAKLAAPLLKDALSLGRPHLLLSAHGLPQSVIDQGDPYEHQIELSSRLIVQCLKEELGDVFDSSVCYQSKVGPKKWLEPATDKRIEELALQNIPLVILPVAFVSDHSETLVELDDDYKTLALNNGAPYYGRVPSLGTEPLFIEALCKIIFDRIQGASMERCCKKDSVPSMICGCSLADQDFHDSINTFHKINTSPLVDKESLANDTFAKNINSHAN